MTSSTTPQATCPKCGSPSVQAVPIEKKKLGEAVLAEYFLGTAAGVAAGSKMVIQAMCLSCGFQWFPGTPAEQRVRALSGQLGEAAKKKVEAEIARERAAKERQSKKDRQQGVVLLLVVLFVGGALWYSRSLRSSPAIAVPTTPTFGPCSEHPETLWVRTLTKARLSRSVGSMWRYEITPGARVVTDSLSNGWYLVCWNGQQPGWVRATELTRRPPN